ncbi:flagellar hook-length control protein FliK [Phosphitispora fastidiosa]|uniref:flagellar hook-length control protein FliK n=1 Tax=Phosphitispora fastidiosa TaxID=2837202 RepID=UPI001E3BD14C|nr:flagellar hook-length control protein FliK [Phosphitispora fastidiosa]MBU7008270.1 flagellar hook-length control protein FliK [Phosphitispora fastidiosa]
MLQTMPFMAIAGNPAVKPGNGPSQDRECRNDVRSSHRAKETPFSETLKDASHNVCENEQNNETAMTERKDSVSRRSGEAGSEKAAAKEADVKDTDVKEVRHPEADELMQLLEMLRELESEAGWNAIAAEGGNQIGLAGGGLSRSEFASLTGLLQDLSSMNNLDPGQLKKLLGNFLKVLEAAGEVSPGMNDLKLLIQNQLNPETGLPREVFLTQLAAKVRQLTGIAGDGSGQNRELSNGSKEAQPASAQKPAEPGGGQAKTTGSGSGDAGRPGSPAVTGENETGGMVKTNTAADVSAKANGAPAMPDSGSGSEAGRRLLEKASASDVVMKTASENQTSAPENARPVGNSEPQAAGPRIEQLQAQVGTQHQYSGNGSADGGSTPGQVSPATYTTQTYQGDRAVFTQIIQKVKLAAAPGTSEMQIELKPEFLGRLKLTVSTENGLVTARFNTHSPQVKAVIEANLAALRDSLADQGIKVDQLSVTVTPEKNHSGQGERDGLFKRRNQARGSRLPLNEDQLETVFSAGARRLTSAGYYGNTVDFTA